MDKPNKRGNKKNNSKITQKQRMQQKGMEMQRKIQEISAKWKWRIVAASNPIC